MEPRAEEVDNSEPVRGGRRKRSTIPLADVGIALTGNKFKVESKESRLEVAARLQAEKAKSDHDLRKDYALFLVVLGIVVVATLACLFIVLSNSYPANIQNAAMALLAAIVSGGVGYATGKSSR
jgi:hypothetical protein